MEVIFIKEKLATHLKREIQNCRFLFLEVKIKSANYL